MPMQASGAVMPTRRYTTADGLARDSVHCIIKDRVGYLWFATGEGISRFDGYSFFNYRVTNGLPDRDVRSIVEDDDGSFLVATGGGAARFDPYGRESEALFQPIATGAGYKANSTRAVLATKGAVWIGTDGGLFVVRNHVAKMVQLDEESEQPSIAKLALDSNGNLWVGTSGALYVVGAKARPIQLIRRRVSALLADEGGVLVATDQRLFRYGSDLRMMKPSIPINRRVLVMLRRRDGALWVGTSNGPGVLEPQHKTFRWLTESEGLADGEVHGLAEDQYGDMWAGYDGAGAVRTSARGLVSYGQQDGLPPGRVASMTVDNKGRLIAMVSNVIGTRVYRLENGRFASVDMGLSSSFYGSPWFAWHEALIEDRAETWWSASRLGLLKLASSNSARTLRLLSRFTVRDGLPEDDVAHVFEDSKGNIWFNTLTMVDYPPPGRASGLGMWERKTGRIRTFSEVDGLPPLNSFAILYMFEDHAGQVWVGLHRIGVARYRKGRFEIFTQQDGVPEGGIRCIYEDSHKHVWLGSGRGGLGRIEDPDAEHLSVRRYSTAEGLASDEIQSITEDNFGRIYAGTGLGVDRVDPETGSILHYTHGDGLAEGEVEDALRDRNGDLWFGTYRGISRLHPTADLKLSAIPVTIATVKVNGRVQPIRLGSDHVTLSDLPPGNNGLEIEFLALAASDANNIRYQYRLNGGKDPWVGPTAARTVTYSGLRPGKYLFEVRSLGDSSGASATVHFVVLPHFWQTWSFLISLVAVVLAILYAVHRYRMANLLRIQQVRTRIANDLHDDIGSGLSKIVILSEVAKRDDKNSHAAALDRIAETSREVLDAVGDLVWTTNARNETVADLVRRMRSFATQLLEAKGIEFEMHTAELPLESTLLPDSLRHLYLIFKEAVNNAARHSQCSRVRVTLRNQFGALVMQISDNGTGFIPAPKPGHHGLENLKARAAQLKGTIEWRVESGTIVELNLPYLFK